MVGAGVTPLCCVLLVAAGGLRLCCGIELLKGLRGQSLSFPALQPVSEDIARVTWRFQRTHIAEAKPRKKMFTVDYLPEFRGRLLIHPGNLSLEIRGLRVRDSGRYEVVVDTFHDPTNPQVFSYLLLVLDGSPETTARTGDTGGQSRSTVGPWDADGGQPPGGGPGGCGVGDSYCVVKGYLVAAVFGLLLLLVAATHVVTRDKATEVSAGSEPPSITPPQGPPPRQ